MSNYLSAEQQQMYYDRMKNGDSQARDIIIESCDHIAMKQAYKFYSTHKHIDLDDLKSEARLALVKAVDKWNIEKGKITTISYHCIYNRLCDFVLECGSTIKHYASIDKNVARDLLLVKRYKDKTVEEISNLTKFKIKKVEKLLKVLNSQRGSIQVCEGVTQDTDSDNNINGCLADLLELLNTSNIQQQDRDIFTHYISFVNKNNKLQLVSEATGIDINTVADSVKSTKKFIKQLFKNQQKVVQ